MATLNTLIRKASILLRFGSLDAPLKSILPDGEVIYCKNNVCVHPPTSLRTELDHHPGYLSIKAQHDEALGSTLILTWIPNSTLKKNPRSLENRTPGSSPSRSARSSTCPSPTLAYFQVHSGSASPMTGSDRCSGEFGHLPYFCRFTHGERERHSISSTISDIGSPREDLQSLDSWTNDQNGVNASTCSHSEKSERKPTVDKPTHEHKKLTVLDDCADNPQQVDSGIGPEEVTAALTSMISGLNDIEDKTNGQLSNNSCFTQSPQPLAVKINGKPAKQFGRTAPVPENKDDNATEQKVESLCSLNKDDNTSSEKKNLKKRKLKLDLRHSDSSSSTTPTTSNKDPESYPSTPTSSSPPSPVLHLKMLYVEGNPESLAHAHNLTFPDNMGNCNSPSRVMVRESSCGVFSVDLSQMRSLRLFFSDKERTCGQLVIASRECQYKILHFHNGGLDKLACVFEDWNILSKPDKKQNENCPYKQFSVCRPEVSADECHPEEGVYSIIDQERWKEFMNEPGQIDDDFQLRKAIFFGGLDPGLRHEAWPFLLHHYDFRTTFDEREQISNDSYIEYQNIRRKRENMNEEEKELFWRNVQCTVEKDVIRTDRTNPFFSGDDNPNIEIMKNILLNYAVYNPVIGYTQGMSDLLAPVLSEIQVEYQAFWCFVGLMQCTIFFSSPKDCDMDINLTYLQELMRMMTPEFYKHLKYLSDGLELLFTHRWILLCFKREFPESEALKMWEACWAHYQTDYFHLFISLSIVAIYGDDVIAQDLRSDEMLLHFSSLAMHMDGEMVLRKARGLLHQFRRLPRIPCTLAKLCELCGPGMWDCRHVLEIECTKKHGGVPCPEGGLDFSGKDA